MLLFRAEEHVEKWCADWNLSRGETLSPDKCWQLAKVWYSADRREPDWRRRTADEAESLFSELGLTSPFWRLLPS
ncbi:MAG TPA: hypothetical protein VNN73_15885 [Blastocatellia bacterium]|nr:hypothetical protein [Blastocatellia bacterium]